MGPSKRGHESRVKYKGKETTFLRMEMYTKVNLKMRNVRDMVS